RLPLERDDDPPALRELLAVGRLPEGGAELRGQAVPDGADEARRGQWPLLGGNRPGQGRRQPEQSRQQQRQPSSAHRHPANTMLTGLPVWMTWPVGVRVPFSWSTRNATIVSVAWFAA